MKRFSDGCRIGKGLAILVSSAFIFSFNTAPAQTTRGSISGFVHDSSGGIVPGVDVTAREVSTGRSHQTVTNSEGFYELLLLPPGRFEVTASLSGFKTFRTDDVVVQVRESVRLDINLQLGEISETITVSGLAVAVDTTKPELGKVVENKDIVDLPLNGRNALQLARLQPGVMPPEPGAVSGNNFSINGQRGQNNNFLLEGGNNNDQAANFPTSNPNVESLQEFKVQSSSYDAEFGRNSGGQINVVVKSGTNQLHGNVYEFHRNDAADSRNFFLSDTEKLIRNQFGFTLGGPVIKDRLFLFGSYEGLRLRSEEAITNPLVPNQDLRNGVVGNLLNDTGRALLDPDGDGVIDVNPVSEALLDRFVGLPTGAIDPDTGLGQLTAAAGQETDNDQFIIKADLQLLDNNSVSVTYLFNDNETFDPTAFGNPGNTVPGFGAMGASRTQNAIINDVHTFSPSLLNQFRFAYNRLSLFSVIPENNDSPASLGFDGINPNNGNFSSVPSVQVTGAFSLGSSIQGPQGRGDDTFDLSDTVTWIRGDHSFKFGFGWTHFNQDQLFNFSNNGLHFFAGVLGDPVVDFLAGTSTLFLQGALPDLHFRQNTLSWFANDSWRLSDRLTLTLGLRYELFFPTSETDDKFGTVDFIGNTEVGDRQSTRFPNAPAGLLFPGDEGIPSSTIETDKINLAPRVGLAYDLTGDGRMSVRAGYGIYYNVINTELQLQFLLTQPFGLLTSLGPLAGGAPFAGGLLGGLLSSPGQFGAPFEGQTNPFPFTSPADTFFTPVDLTVLDPNLATPYSHQYSLSFQWEVLRGYVFEAAYVGSTGINLLNRNLFNVIPFQRNADNTIEVLADEPGNPNLNKNQTVQTASANSNYNALQLSLNKRFSNGLGFLASYTYSHSVDNTSGLRDSGIQDPFRQDLEKGNSNFDITNRFVLSGQYELPFGRGKRFASGASGWVGKLIEGWQVGGILTLDDGFPLDFGVSGASTTGALLALADRPSIVGDPLAGVDTGDTQGRGVDEGTSFFNRDAFVRCDDVHAGGVGGPCFGNLGRNRLRGPGDVNFDFIAMKRTSVPQLGDLANVEFRFEAFNLFNNPNFSQPGTTLGAPNFGRITSLKNGFGPRILQFALKVNF